MPQRPESPTFTLYDTSSPIRNNQSFPIYHDKSDRKAKRKAFDIFETPPHEPVGISAFAGGQWTGSSKKEIKPFSSIASLGDPPKRPIFEPRDMTPTPVLGDAKLLDESMTLWNPSRSRWRSTYRRKKLTPTSPRQEPLMTTTTTKQSTTTTTARRRRCFW